MAFLLGLNIINQIGSGLAHKCFVCGPDGGRFEDMKEMKRNFPDMKKTDVPLCSKYRHHSRDSFVKECPPTSHGCLTKIEGGGSIIRTCAPVAIDDCKVANGVTYCYCSSDKCNTPDRRLSDPHPAPSTGHHNPSQGALLSDDEDNTEGSAWPSFYYDNYYERPDGDYDEETFSDGDYDIGNGYGGPEYEDTTDPPDFMKEELDREYAARNNNNRRGPNSKFDRNNENDLVFDDDKEEGVRRTEKGKGSGETCISLSVILLLLSALVVSL